MRGGYVQIDASHGSHGGGTPRCPAGHGTLLWEMIWPAPMTHKRSKHFQNQGHFAPLQQRPGCDIGKALVMDDITYVHARRLRKQ